MEPKPPGSPAKTPWKGVRLEKLAINLTDAMEDSPIFRDKIKREEEVRIDCFMLVRFYASWIELELILN